MKTDFGPRRFKYVFPAWW